MHFPVPPPRPGGDDGRADEAQRIVSAGLKLAPDLQVIHPLTDVRAVEEDYPLLERSFLLFTYRSYDFVRPGSSLLQVLLIGLHGAWILVA